MHFVMSRNAVFLHTGESAGLFQEFMGYSRKSLYVLPLRDSGEASTRQCINTIHSSHFIGFRESNVSFISKST
jgi:hypothetical protein